MRTDGGETENSAHPSRVPSRGLFVGTFGGEDRELGLMGLYITGLTFKWVCVEQNAKLGEQNLMVMGFTIMYYLSLSSHE